MSSARRQALVLRPAARVLIVLLALLFMLAGPHLWLRAQEAERLPMPKIEQLVAPIALFPDPLLAQVLMASTYPLEIVQADRWRKANPKVSGKALEQAMQGQPWDASVKALTAVPDTLRMMSEKLDWTQALGDVFLAQQEDVLAAVQTLRARAQAADQLKTTAQQKVETRGSAPNQIVVIEPTDPEVIYLPVYDPGVIYGAWPYPEYPPYYWYPPGYSVGRLLTFAAGVAVGAAIWGHCDWDRRDIRIDVDRYNRFNRTKITSNNWEHNSVHRKGVPYRDRDVAEKFGKGGRDVQAREEFRGRVKEAKGQINGKEVLPKAGALKGDAKAAAKADLADRAKSDLKGKGAPKGDAKRDAKRDAARDRSREVSSKAKGQPKATKVAARHQAAQPRAFDDIGRGQQVRRHSDRGRSSRVASAGRQHNVSAFRGGGGGGGRARGGGGRRR
jgi:hypothetical protein